MKWPEMFDVSDKLTPASGFRRERKLSRIATMAREKRARGAGCRAANRPREDSVCPDFRRLICPSVRPRELRSRPQMRAGGAAPLRVTGNSRTRMCITHLEVHSYASASYGMSLADPMAWARWLSGEDCPICSTTLVLRVSHVAHAGRPFAALGLWSLVSGALSTPAPALSRCAVTEPAEGNVLSHCRMGRRLVKMD
jgi:hypothetical protein